MKNRIGLRLAAAVGVVALAVTMAGCSTSSSTDTKTITTLSLYSADSPAGKWLNSMSAAFKKESGITVKNEFVAQTDLPNTYGKAVIAKTEQDIVMTNLVGEPTTWLKNGATVDVTKYVKDWGLSKVFSDNAIGAWTNSSGKVQAFPLEGYNWPMWYNMDLLKAAGFDAPPTTWSQLIAVSKALRANGVQPFVVAAADYPAPAILTLAGLATIGNDNLEKLFAKGDWDSANGQKVIKGFIELRDAGVFEDDSAALKYPDQVAAFGAGKAAMLFDGSWAYGNAASAFPKLNVKLGGFPLPKGSPVAKPISFAGQSTGVWISPNGAKKIDAVQKFIQFMYEPKNLAGFVNIGYVSPAKPGYVKLDTTALPALNVQSQKVLPVDTAVLTPTYNALSPSVTSAFFRASGQAFVAGTTAAQLTESLDQAWQAQ